MPRYIDADKVLTDELTHVLPNECGMSSGRVIIFVDDIEKIPTADVQEVRHSKWVEKEFDIDGEKEIGIVCEHCGASRVAGTGLAKYCYMCGAKMDEE